MSETTNGLHATVAGFNEVNIKKQSKVFQFCKVHSVFYTLLCSALEKK
jgi:hypothetical protein